ncbi:MAG: DUF4105 domain-containing protein [Pseudomonadota bacterium]
MTRPVPYTVRSLLGDAVLLALAIGLAVFAWLALDIHVPPPWTRPAQVATITVLALALALRFRARALGWGIVLAVGAVHLGWFLALQPRADRDWAPPLAHSVTGHVTDGIAHLENVRDFDWRDPDTATERWVDGTYPLDGIARVDLITSVWDDPDIAHILVSFLFEDGRDLAFSIEVRREADEDFSIRGGFLREFELALIAAPERDLVDLRVDARREEVRRYPTTLTHAQGADLFRAYVDLGNDLSVDPRFYNTITANCTTVAWSIAHVLKDDLPVDRRLLLSGRLPEYLEALGILDGDVDMATRKRDALIRPADG